MKKNRVIFCAVVLFFGFTFSINAAETLTISLDGERFAAGDIVGITGEFTNNGNSAVEGYLVCGIRSADPSMPSMPQAEEINMEPGETKNISCETQINESFKNGFYIAEVSVLGKGRNTMLKQEKSFIIYGTTESVSAELKVCGDADCVDEKSVFIQYDEIYLVLSANAKDPIIKAKVIDYNSDDEKVVDLKIGANKIVAENAGSFVLDVDISHADSKILRITKNYAIIEKQAKIQTISVCNNDGLCLEGETTLNCSADCKIEKKSQFSGIILLSIVSLLVVALLAIIFIFYKRIKGNISDSDY